MWFELALRLGRTVKELQSTMSSAEYAEWAAFFELRSARVNDSDASREDIRSQFDKVLARTGVRRP